MLIKKKNSLKYSEINFRKSHEISRWVEQPNRTYTKYIICTVITLCVGWGFEVHPSSFLLTVCAMNIFGIWHSVTFPKIYLATFWRNFFFPSTFFCPPVTSSFWHTHMTKKCFIDYSSYRKDRYETSHTFSNDEVLQIPYFIFSIMAEFLMTSSFFDFF